MKRPLFSCVIPVKGDRPFFDEALASLKSQGMGDDLEIIVQDADVFNTKSQRHGGTEDFRGVCGAGKNSSESLCLCVEKNIDGVRWCKELDKGQSDALNKGFAKARGEWLFWLNADDVLLPGALHKVIQLLHSPTFNFSTSPCWIAGNQLLIDDVGKVVGCSVGNGWHSWLYRHAVPHVYGPSSFFKRNLFERVGGLDVSLNYCMDWDLWIRFMKNEARFARINDYVWAQRQWLGSKTQRSKSKSEAEKQWVEIRSMLAKNGIGSTTLGAMQMRLWRFLNGNMLRQAVDLMKFRGKYYSEVCV